jgi:hypothetical protein
MAWPGSSANDDPRGRSEERTDRPARATDPSFRHAKRIRQEAVARCKALVFSANTAEPASRSPVVMLVRRCIMEWTSNGEKPHESAVGPKLNKPAEQVMSGPDE